MSEPRDATRITVAANAAVRKVLPFGDTQDFDDVNRGLIASLPDGGVIKNAGGRVVWDLSNVDIIEGETGLIIVDPLISAECATEGHDRLWPGHLDVVGNDHVCAAA